MTGFDYEKFGRHLRECRERLGLSEAEAAAAAGRTVATWRKYEATGRGNITGPFLRFANAYCVDLDWLACLGGRAPRPRLRLVHDSKEVQP